VGESRKEKRCERKRSVGGSQGKERREDRRRDRKESWQRKRERKRGGGISEGPFLTSKFCEQKPGVAPDPLMSLVAQLISFSMASQQ